MNTSNRTSSSRGAVRRRVIRTAVVGLLPALSAAAWAQSSVTSAPAQQLEEVIVTGKIDFTQNDAFGATKMGLEVKETPQTVNIVTADLIEVASLQSFNDFYKVDASTGVTHSTDGWPRNYYRGFFQDGANAVRVDGFRMPGNIELDLAIFDRFEVVKGATSTLYGQNNIGGALNGVSKLPQQQSAATLSAEVAQYDHYRAEGDVTGALFGSDAWSYRLIGVYQDADSFIDYAGEDINLVSASIKYQPSNATRVVLRYTNQETDARYAYGNNLQLAGNGTGFSDERALAEGLKEANLPRSTFFGMPWNYNTKKSQFLQLQADQDIGGWRLRAHAQYSKNDEDGQNFWAGGPIDQNGADETNWSQGGSYDSELHGVEINLFGDFETLGMTNTLFLGIDYAEIDNSAHTAEIYSQDFDSSAFNVLAPRYTLPGPPDWDSYEYFYGIRDRQELAGATAQVIMRPTARLSVLAGLRYSDDTIKNGFAAAESPEDAQVTAANIEDISASKLTYQAGVTFELTDSVNLYASYGRTFESQSSRVFVEGDPDGVLIDPLEGVSYEIGAKADLHSDLMLTAALFELEKTNIALSDSVNGYPFAFPLGKQRSRGVELGLQGKVLPPVSVNVSLAWLDAEYLEGPFDGLRPANAPKFGASAFATYEVLEGAFEGLGFSAGVVHKRGRVGFDAGWTEFLGEPVLFDFGDFTEVDVGAFYTTGQWRVSLNVTNLLNEKYYSQTFEELWWSTNVNPPSTVRGRVTYRF